MKENSIPVSIDIVNGHVIDFAESPSDVMQDNHMTPLDLPDDGIHFNVTGLQVKSGGAQGIQTFQIVGGYNLITTAYGVAPAGLSGKCLWLHNNIGGHKVEWELQKSGPTSYYILIPKKVINKETQK